MSLDATQLKCIAQTGDHSVFVYWTTDAIATVVGSGYFNSVYQNLKNGDVIIVVDTNVPTIDVCAVTSATGATTVTTQNGT